MRKSAVVAIVAGAVVVVGGVVTGVALASSGGSSPTASSPTSASSTPSSTPSKHPPSTPSPGATPTVQPLPGKTVTPAPSSSATSAPTTAQKSVTPLITFDQWTAATSTLTIGANVPGLVETGGTCALTATNGSSSVSGTFTSTPTASSTDCGSMALSSTQFHSGSWSVSLTYSSPTAKGTTDDYEVSIP